MAIPEKFAQAEEALHEAAIRETGLHDFGDGEYLTGLHVLLNALDTDLKLTEYGASGCSARLWAS